MRAADALLDLYEEYETWLESDLLPAIEQGRVPGLGLTSSTANASVDKKVFYETAASACEEKAG